MKHPKELRITCKKHRKMRKMTGGVCYGNGFWKYDADDECVEHF